MERKKIQYLTGLSASPELKTEFLGYTEFKTQAKVLYLFVDGKSVSEANQGSEAVLVLDKTPFYAEGGGQVGDWGYLKKEGFQFQVQDTQKENETFLHLGIILKGKISVGETIEAEIDTTRRQNLANHHSGTHLLNGALRRILGNHVAQKGSIVSSDYLRFDFSHPKALSEEEIVSIEKDVNEAVNAKISVKTEVLDIDAAKKSGALSMFDEKYGNLVRVISMGDKSKEFCGGTHVTNTKEIGYFAIIKEGSPGAGNRRVEAICGDSVIEYFLSQFQTLAAKVETHNLSAKETFGDLKEFGIGTAVPAPEDLQSLFVKEGNTVVEHLRKLRESLETELEEKSSALFKAKKKKEQLSFQMNPELVDGLLKKHILFLREKW